LHLIIPAGVLSPQLKAFCGDAARGATGRVGHLQVSVVPFLAQARFDLLLWAVDAALVRGEDSFVRAQLAGLPMLWDIYPQSAGAHLKKLAAFLDRYQSELSEDKGQTHRRLSRALIDRSDSFAGLFASWSENLWKYRKCSAELAKVARKLLE
jgi:uncharacterized repeat protein (TIGR03837 family)